MCIGTLRDDDMLCIVTERPADPLMTPSVRYTEMGKAYLKIKRKIVNSDFSNYKNDGAKRSRLLYLKIMYTAIKKILHLP